jgi:phosphonate transport system permease protein
MSTTLPLQAMGMSGPLEPQKALRAAVRVREVTLTYPQGSVQALRGLTLTIPVGQHVALLGSSGSGKTSLLGCLSGRLSPTSGSIECGGRIAVIHQDLRLVKQRSALQNVLHGCMGRHAWWRTMAGFPRAERARAIALLQRVGLGQRVQAKVKHLSGGEQQRVAIARALMQDPAILLADEPVASLDKHNAQAVMQLLRDLARERELTMVSVLHDCELAENYADRLVGLDGGKLIYDQVAGSAIRFESCGACAVMHPGGESVAEGSTGARPGDQGAGPRRETIGEAAVFGASPLRFALLVLAVAAVYGVAIAGMRVEPRQLEGIVPGLWAFLRRLMPDSWSQLAALPWSKMLWAMVETLQMSLLGTTLGVLVSWPLAALAARNVGPRWIRPAMRFVLNTVRTVPSLIWALLFVAAVGLGPVAGVLALFAYSIGYLTKFFYEAFEAVDPGPPGALGEIGANGPQRFFHAVWPAATPAVLSSSLFMLEYNVRAASVLGIVDAGGIGYYLKWFIDWGNFPAVTVCLVLLLAVVVVLDQISTRLRARLVR